MRTLPLALALLAVPFASAQTWSWATAAAHTADGRGGGSAVATDAAGNAYVVGSFAEQMTVGGTTLTAVQDDAFVLKVAPSGALVWAVQIGGDGLDSAADVAVGPDGSVVVIGGFSGTATAGGTTLTSAGSADAFLAKLTADGAVTWAVALGGANFDTGNGVGVDAAGAIYATGGFVETTDIGGTALTSAGSGDLWVARIDASGAVTRATSAGGPGSDLALGLAVAADGGVALAGRFEQTAAFGTASVTSAGAGDAFVARYAPDGTVAWAASGGNPTNNDYGFGVAFTSGGDVVVSGEFSNTATFGAESVTSAGSADAFVARYGADGALTWLRPIGGTEYDSSRGVAVGAGDAITVTGSFNGAVALGATTLTSAGRADVFLARLAGDGSPTWAVRAGGPGTAGFSDRAGGLATSGGGVVATGSFYEDADFGPFTLSATPQNHSGIFVVGLDVGGVAAEGGPEGSALTLAAPRPNPSAGAVTVGLAVRGAEAVRAEVFDVLGRRAAVVFDGVVRGSATLRVDATALPAGAYVLRVTGAGETATRPFAVVR